MRIWKPNVTVAAVIEQDGRFLMVEEETPEGLRLNQPAGHLEHGETLFEAVRREVLEETAWHFEPEALVGIYLADKPGSDITYLRFTFCGKVLQQENGRQLDEGIIAARWLSAAEIRARTRHHRSPAVALSLDDWLAGQRLPLSVIRHLNGGNKA